jgi:HlyD family secretion protein
MLRKYLLPSFAICGAIIGLLVVFWSQRKQPVPLIPFPPPTSPYVHAIYGEGIAEASSHDLSIGSPFSEVVTKVYVVEGDYVKKGDPLFQLDTRLFQAQAETARNQIRAAIINMENLRTQFGFYESLSDKRAVSKQQYEQSYYAFKEAEEQVAVAKGVLGEVNANIERSLIRAPIDGKVLQVNIHVGEVAPNVPPISSQVITPYSSSQFPLLILGRVEPLYLRIDIDQEDAWRYKKGTPATAFVRGNSHLRYPLQFVRIEPFMIPKASFTGQTTERIDTRVLQVLYRFESTDIDIYPGQVLDVYLEASPLP